MCQLEILTALQDWEPMVTVAFVASENDPVLSMTPGTVGLS